MQHAAATERDERDAETAMGQTEANPTPTPLIERQERERTDGRGNLCGVRSGGRGEIAGEAEASSVSPSLPQGFVTHSLSRPSPSRCG